MVNNKWITWFAAQIHEDSKDIRRAFNQRSPTIVTHLTSWYGSRSYGTHVYATLKLYHSIFGNTGTNTVAELLWNLSEEPKKSVGAMVASLICRPFRPLILMACRTSFVKNSDRPKNFWARTLLLHEMQQEVCRRYGPNFHTPHAALAARLLISPSRLLFFKKLQWCT